ncbi:MAG TPA: TetR family transcriptional regulator [Lichenihabitans sp.]|jgi:AcrR family transcriptional regulator|nr:TetR family transcriptional regulator [Lichenihabitans sp.]
MEKPIRSQATRDRILAEAKRLFGEGGYDRTTIRAVATAADIHPSMVMRYFGSKEGLFAAAADFDLRLPDLRRVPPGERGRALVRHFLDRWEGAGSGGDLPALLRLAATHEPARARMLDVFRHQVVPAIAVITSPAGAAERAALIGTQLIGLAFARYVLKLPPIVALDPRDIEDNVGKVVQAHLDADSPD